MENALNAVPGRCAGDATCQSSSVAAGGMLSGARGADSTFFSSTVTESCRTSSSCFCTGATSSVGRRPGQRLVLPPVARLSTLILHDVGALSFDDQRRLTEWLEEPLGSECR